MASLAQSIHYTTTTGTSQVLGRHIPIYYYTTQPPHNKPAFGCSFSPSLRRDEALPYLCSVVTLTIAHTHNRLRTARSQARVGCFGVVRVRAVASMTYSGNFSQSVCVTHNSQTKRRAIWRVFLFDIHHRAVEPVCRNDTNPETVFRGESLKSPLHLSAGGVF